MTAYRATSLNPYFFALHGRDCRYAFALAFSLTCPSVSSTENSTSWQPYFLRISSVFFCTKVAKESRLPETFSPVCFGGTVHWDARDKHWGHEEDCGLKQQTALR